ncbi:hypothetical protein [Microseira sp. BLCC-F43]|jgi:hypothetical protein|uniref:hypothetical protein n=1 Tax=Microseira sp. BLCC-F43 TaxID=3153602 RepID=UPI0035B9C19D
MLRNQETQTFGFANLLLDRFGHIHWQRSQFFHPTRRYAYGTLRERTSNQKQASFQYN